MADHNPSDNFFELRANGTTNNDEDQNENENTQSAFATLGRFENPLHPNNGDGDEVEERRANANRLAQAQAQRNRENLGYDTNLNPSFHGAAHHNQRAPFHPRFAHAPAHQYTNVPGYNNNLPSSSPGTAQRLPSYTQWDPAHAAQSPQVAPTARILPMAPAQQFTTDQFQFQRANLANTQNSLYEIPRHTVDQLFRGSMNNPELLDDFVHAWQTAVAQRNVHNTDRLLREAMAANGGQVPDHLVPYLAPQQIEPLPPNYVPMQVTFPGMGTNRDMTTPRGVNAYLIEFSTRHPGFFGSSVFETGSEGGWASYMPATIEVTMWRSLLMHGIHPSNEFGVMWIVAALNYIASTATHRLEIYGITDDRNVGLHDTREAFEYLLDRVRREMSHDQRIQELVQRVQGLLRNVPPFPLAGPSQGIQLVNEFIREVGGEDFAVRPRARTSSGARLGESRPPVPPSSTTGSAMGRPQAFTGMPTAPMRSGDFRSGAGGPGPGFIRNLSEFLGGRPTASPAPGSLAFRGQSPLPGGYPTDFSPSSVGAPTREQSPSNASRPPTRRATPAADPTLSSEGSMRPPNRRRAGRPRGSIAGGRAGGGRGSNTGSSTATPSTLTAPARVRQSQLPTSVYNDPIEAPSMPGQQPASTGEVPGTVSWRGRRRMANTSNDTPSARQPQDDDEDDAPARCSQCARIGTHAPLCPLVVERCRECGTLPRNHKWNCSKK